MFCPLKENPMEHLMILSWASLDNIYHISSTGMEPYGALYHIVLDTGTL